MCDLQGSPVGRNCSHGRVHHRGSRYSALQQVNDTCMVTYLHPAILHGPCPSVLEPSLLTSSYCVTSLKSQSVNKASLHTLRDMIQALIGYQLVQLGQEQVHTFHTGNLDTDRGSGVRLGVKPTSELPRRRFCFMHHTCSHLALNANQQAFLFQTNMHLKD